MNRSNFKASPLLAIPFAMAGLALTPSLFANQQAGWSVVVATNAFVSHGTSVNFTPAAIGAVVGAGDRLTTRSGGALVLSRGADLITMTENTQVAIADPQPVNETLLEQPYGQAQYKVEHKAVPHFEVDTPMLATVVKGTTFTVHAAATGGSVSVQDGRVTAIDRRTGASSSVGTGQRGSVQNGSGSVSVSADVSGASSPSAPAPGAPAPGPKDKPKGSDKPGGPDKPGAPDKSDGHDKPDKPDKGGKGKGKDK